MKLVRVLDRDVSEAVLDGLAARRGYNTEEKPLLMMTMVIL